MMLDERPQAGAFGTSLPGAPELSPRAVNARLTLQLRAAMRDVAVAEEAEKTVDSELARLELRERLTPMLEERRRVLHEVLVEAQADAATRVADAHRHATEKNVEDFELSWAPQATPPSADDLLASLPSNLPSNLPSSVPLGLDPLEMATLFKMLDARLEQLVPASVPKKPSFWKHVLHPDVVIVGMIMIFCLVVVASWMS